MSYTKDDCIKIAARLNNTKRPYLLVNPLQAKHVPVSPTAALKMMGTLADKLAEKYPNTKLVIGFAETATAIGAVVASRFDGCFYLQTTREALPEDLAAVEFLEEHSHATEQTLCTEYFESALSLTDSVIFVDDEISTGKTLLNIIEQLRAKFPALLNKTTVVASIVNRVSTADGQRLEAAHILSEQLIKIPNEDYSALAARYKTEAPKRVNAGVPRNFTVSTLNISLGNPRTGVNFGDYNRSCLNLAAQAVKYKTAGEILVLGTEECMYPALILGSKIEAEGGCRVFCHATTRSPISVCGEENYPVKNGYRVGSFYDGARINYIYNLRHYDKVFIVTDAEDKGGNAIDDISTVFSEYGCRDFVIVRGLKNV